LDLLLRCSAESDGHGLIRSDTDPSRFIAADAQAITAYVDLEGIAVSTGSACSSGTLEPSHVLRAMGLSSHRTQNSLRFSLGLFSTEEEVDRVIAVLPELVEKLRNLTRKVKTENFEVKRT
jgi:cysteine desulfurase